MKKHKILCIIGIIILIGILFVLNVNNTFAAINIDYYSAINESMGVDDRNVEKSVVASTILDAIAVLVYAVANLIEKIIGYIFKLMSGDNIFPWADAILFNAIPMLDINVFNPSGTSVIKTLYDTVAGIYWTVFSLAVSFFGIAIMVTAIKLVISTIASDKASYKQSIVKWIMGFVMLWGIHFFMSFAIYLNEQLVVEAQKIASKAAGDTVLSLRALTESDDADLELVKSFVEAMTTYDIDWGKVFGTLLTVAAFLVIGKLLFHWHLGFFVTTFILALTTGAAMAFPTPEENLTDIRYAMDEKIIEKGKEIFKDNATNEEANAVLKLLYDNYKIAAKLLRDAEYVETLEHRLGCELAEGTGISEEWRQITGGDAVRAKAAVILLAYDAASVNGDGNGNPIMLVDEEDGKEIKYIDILRAYIKAVESISEMDLITRVRDPLPSFDSTIYYYDASGNPKKCRDKAAFTADGVCVKDNLHAADAEDGTLGEANPADYVNFDFTFYLHAKRVIKIVDVDYEALEEGDPESENNSAIATLANTFKELAWKYSDASWTKSKLTIEGALLYATLVAQSIIFLIAYAKRLFYIIILIVMAPVVVVYDFFNRF